MFKPIVTLLAIAATVGTVFASDTPSRGRWTKVGGTWSYVPEGMDKTSTAGSQPTMVPEVILPLSSSPDLNVTVVPRFVKGGRNAVQKRCSECGGDEEEEGDNGDEDEEKGDEEEESDDKEEDEEEEEKPEKRDEKKRDDCFPP